VPAGESGGKWVSTRQRRGASGGSAVPHGFLEWVMLLFKKKFLDSIRAGEKTQTIRLWKRPLMRSGQRSYIPGVGYIRITLVEAVELPNLSDADAQPDGFPSADALREEIATLYGEQASTYTAYRVLFHVLPPEEQEAARREKEARQQKGEPEQKRKKGEPGL